MRTRADGRGIFDDARSTRHRTLRAAGHAAVHREVEHAVDEAR
jgi:hypothetical protein